MPGYEYKVVPAPVRGQKAKGLKTPEQRFAFSVETLLNSLGAQGWEYQRAEMLPSEERTGLTGSTTNWRNMLVFRRALRTTEMREPAPGTMAETGFPALGGAARQAPASSAVASASPPLRAVEEPAAPRRSPPPVHVSAQDSTEAPPPPAPEKDSTPLSSIEKVMRFSARRGDTADRGPKSD